MKFCHNVVSGGETTASMYCVNSYFSTAALSSRNHLCCSGEMAGCEVVNSAISNVNSVSDQRLQRTERVMKKKKQKIQKKRMLQICVRLFFRRGCGVFSWFCFSFFKLKRKAQVCWTLVPDAILSPTLRSTKNGAHASTSAALVHIQLSVDGSWR